MGQPNPVAVLDKAVAILRAVADEPATLADLVERTGRDLGADPLPAEEIVLKPIPNGAFA